MSFLKRAKKQNVSTNQPSNNDPKNQAKETAKAIVLKTFGNKAGIQQVLHARCNVSALPLDKLKLDALKDFPLNPDPKIIQAYEVMTLQLSSYSQLMSAYKEFAERCVAARCPALFWRYHPRIKQLVRDIQQETLLKNAEKMVDVMEQTTTKDPTGDEQRLKAAQELVKQLQSHIGAGIMDEIEKSVPKVNMEELKAPILEGLDKQLFAGTADDEEDFFKDFMKRHEIDVEVFKEKVDPERAEDVNDADEQAAQERLEKWRKEQKHLGA